MRQRRQHLLLVTRAPHPRIQPPPVSPGRPLAPPRDRSTLALLVALAALAVALLIGCGVPDAPMDAGSTDMACSESRACCDARENCRECGAPWDARCERCADRIAAACVVAP